MKKSPLRHLIVTGQFHLELIFYKTYANLKREIDKMYLGCLWWLFEPIINTVVMYLIFSHVLKNRTENFIVFIFIGTVVYGHIASSISNGASAIISNANLLSFYNFSKMIYPIVSILNITWKFLFSFMVILPLLWFLKMPITMAYLALPLLLAYQVFIGISICLPFCILMPYFQDGKTVLATVMSVGIWLSGVFYTSEQVPEHLRQLFYFNPAAVTIEAHRDILMYGRWPHWERFITSGTFCLASCLLGLYLMKKLSRKITKIPM